jgi:enoyl-CoA hydratase/carnithine racemase
MTVAQPAPSARVEAGQEGGVITLTLKNPPVNALGPPVVKELAAAFDRIEKDAGARVVVITGAGRFFSAGADVGEMARSPYEQVAEYVRMGRALFDRIAAFPKPVVAAVNGFALGGGCELALACDLCLMAESARLGLPEINLGILPGWGGIQRLARAVGKSRALEVVLTGRMVEPKEAHALGLAVQVTPDAELPAAAKTLAQQLAGKAPLAVREIKARVATGLGVPVNEAVLGDLEAFLRILRSQDAKEGMAAFLGKRQPNFQGK